MKQHWEIERITRDESDLHGEIGSMVRHDEHGLPWLWRLMLGRRVVHLGRAEHRDEAIANLLDVWDKIEGRLELPPDDHPGWDRLLDDVASMDA